MNKVFFYLTTHRVSSKTHMDEYRFQERPETSTVHHIFKESFFPFLLIILLGLLYLNLTFYPYFHSRHIIH